MVQNFGNGDIDHKNVFLFPNTGSVLELYILKILSHKGRAVLHIFPPKSKNKTIILIQNGSFFRVLLSLNCSRQSQRDGP